MASFQAELPIEIIRSFEELHSSTEEMLGKMTRAGAETAYKNVVTNMRKSFKDSSELEKCLKLTKTYKTPSDDGINTKVGIYGYFVNKQGEKVPAPLVANAREYGAKKNRAGIEPAKPFFRKSFKKGEITNAMLEEQDKYLPKE